MIIIFSSRSKVLFVSAVLGVLYTIYIIAYFYGINTNTSDTSTAIGGALATALVAPHMALVALATIFNVLAFFMNGKGFAIAAGVLYVVGGVLFLPYIIFVLPTFILCFIGVGQVGKIKAKAATNNDVVVEKMQ